MRRIAVGDFNGRLQVLDLERPEIAVYNVEAHSTIVNTIDAIQGNAPGVDITPGDHPDESTDKIQTKRDCWAVAFGDSYNNEERVVAAGYDNGDLKLFDLRQLSVRWETKLKNGVCSIEFDRRDIPMNKMLVTTLEGGLLVYDMRSQHPTQGFAYLEERSAGRSVGSNGLISGPKATVWCDRHLPQNRDVFVTGGGLCACGVMNIMRNV
uniref:WD repeat-containing protein 92 n=1 Tax=Glossina palpalis gambiensis TaxID=67801 RepID=A0A1B0B9E8_9MUSC